MKKLYLLGAVLFVVTANLFGAETKRMEDVFGKIKLLLDQHAQEGGWESWSEPDYEKLKNLQGDAWRIKKDVLPFVETYIAEYNNIKDANNRKKFVGIVTTVAPRILTATGLRRMEMLTLKTEIQSVASLGDDTSKALAKIFEAREKELATPVEQSKQTVRPQEPQLGKMEPARLPAKPKPVVGKGQPKPPMVKELESAMAERKRKAELGPVVPGRLPLGPGQPVGPRLPQQPMVALKPIPKTIKVRREAAETQTFERHYAEFKKKHAAVQQPMPVQVTQQPTAQPVSQSVQEVERAEEAAITRRFVAASQESDIPEMEKIYAEAQAKFAKFQTIPADFLTGVLAGYTNIMDQKKATLKWGGELQIARFRQHGIDTPEEYQQIVTGKGGGVGGDRPWEWRKMAGELPKPSPLTRAELAESVRLRDDFYNAAQEGNVKKMESYYKVAEEYYKKLTTIPEQQWKYRLKEMRAMAEFINLYDQFIDAAAREDLESMDEFYDDAEEIAEKTFTVQRLPYFELMVSGTSAGPTQLQNLIKEIFADRLDRMEKLIAKELKRRHKGSERQSPTPQMEQKSSSNDGA